MAFKLARKNKKEKKAKNVSPKKSNANNSKKSSQADDVLAFLEQEKKNAKIKEKAGECMFC